MKWSSLVLLVTALGIGPLGTLSAERVTIGVFVPGVTAGSPLYEQMVSGAMRAAQEHPNVTVKVVEGGFNQAEWPERVTSMAATGEYTYILTTNMAMPAICADVASSFPKQKFIVLDGFLAGNPSIYTLMYNQVEQGYMAGYLAGLVTRKAGKTKVGAIVAQEYPALTVEIIPGFIKGFQAVDKNISLDYRVVGNWWDANKAADLANSMMDAGVDVILSIAGGAGQGIIKAAQQRGKDVVAFDSNVYKLAPGTIIGCATLEQERATYEALTKALAGTLRWGTADVVNARTGYVGFADADPLYTTNVPQDVRTRMAAVLADLRGGRLDLPVPQL